MSSTRSPFSASSGSEESDVATVSVRERLSAPTYAVPESIKKEHALLSAFVEHVPAAIAMFDRSMRYLRVSNRWLEIFNLAREDIIGHSQYEVFPNIPERWKDAHRRCLEGATEKVDEDVLIQADGTELRLCWEAQPWGDLSMPNSGVLVFAEDITARKQVEHDRVADETRLRAAQSAAEIGTWEWNPASGMGTLSPALHQMFGTSPTDRDYLAKWMTRVYPDDRRRLELEMEIAAHTGVMEFEYRYQRPKLGLRWYYCKGRRLSQHGSLFGVVIDITERRRAEDELKHERDQFETAVQERTLELASFSEELRRSEEQFRLLVEGVQDYAIFMLDIDGHILSWNLGAQRIKGYTPHEIIGKHFSVFYPSQDIRADKPARELEIAAKEGRFEEEGWRVRKDGSRFWANVVLTALFEGGVLRGFAKVTRDITERKRTERVVRELSGRLLKIQDEERRRLARELHDSTGQLLSALSLNLTVIKQSDDERGGETASIITECLALTDEAAQEIRTLSYLLHPPLLDQAGLTHALRWYVDGFMHRTSIKVDLKMTSDIERLPEEYELTLFRIVQEGLTNIHRHSGSDTAEIHLHRDFSHIMLDVRDRGKGIPDSAYRHDADGAVTLGVGVRGMRERVRQLGGSLEIGPANPGTILRVILPTL